MFTIIPHDESMQCLSYIMLLIMPGAFKGFTVHFTNYIWYIFCYLSINIAVYYENVQVIIISMYFILISYLSHIISIATNIVDIFMTFLTKKKEQFVKFDVHSWATNKIAMTLALLPFQLNSLWPSDVIGWHRYGPKLDQFISYCLMAPILT